MATEQAVLGVDVGGTGVRAALRRGERVIRTRDTGPVPRRAGRIDPDALARRVLELADSLMGDAHVDRMAVGLTGMPELLSDPAALAENLAKAANATSLWVAADSLTTHLGALAGRRGIVTSAGTGAITLGTDFGGTWNRVDGWGHLVGDEGSGAWIGRECVRKALRHADGRNGAGALHGIVEARFGSAANAIDALYHAQSPAHVLANLAPAVAEAAMAGDEDAADIWERAGRLLGEAAVAASRGLPALFSWGGRLFDAGDLLLKPFQGAIRDAIPDASIVAPAGTSTDGALTLAAHGLPNDTGPCHTVFRLSNS